MMRGVKFYSLTFRQEQYKGLCQKSDFGPAYHKLGSYHVSI